MGADTRTYLCNPFLYQHVLLLKISQRSHPLAQCSNRTPELAHNIGSELDWISFYHRRDHHMDHPDAALFFYV